MVAISHWQVDGLADDNAACLRCNRGGQCCSTDYQNLLQRHNQQGSISTRGCCYEYACAESFFNMPINVMINADELNIYHLELIFYCCYERKNNLDGVQELFKLILNKATLILSGVK